MNDNFEFFYGGPFSQWYPHAFTLHGVTYSCAEQYMMAMKAALFEDYATLEKIMATKKPHEQKAFGRLVKNFNAEQWNAVCKQFVYEANYAKFSDPELKAYILNTGNKEIVEASPTDTIWGIGLPENHSNLWDRSQWRGTNWLGEVLMKVRADLKRLE